MEMNENKTLDSFISVVYCLGFHVSGNTVRSGDDSSVHARFDPFPDLGPDPVPLATCSRRHDANHEQLEIYGDRRNIVAPRR